MPVLQNSKHERFALGIAAGKSGREAYRAAGYQPKSDAVADAAASRLLAAVKVAARVAELKKEIADKAVDASVMDLKEVLQELSKLGRSDIRNCVVDGDDTGDVVASIHDMLPAHSAAVQELTVETYLEGSGEDAREVKRVKVKLHDKRGALSELRRHYEPQRHEHSGKDGKPIEVEQPQLSPTELARRIAFALARALRAKDVVAKESTTAPAPPAAAAS